MLKHFYPTLKDFDKPINDLIKDDFDLKYNLKLKGFGPNGTIVTSTTQYDDKANKLIPKLSIKGSLPAGFSLDKLESTVDRKIAFEGSLADLAPGVKLEFKGNDTDRADFGVSYRHPMATATMDLDVLKFNFAKFSVNGGSGPFTVGVGADISLQNTKTSSPTDNTILSVGAGYILPRQLFVGVRSEKNFKHHSLLFRYIATPELTVAGKIEHNNTATTATAVGVYRCCPSTLVKARANTDGNVALSVKQIIEKNMSITGVVEVPKTLDNAKLGVSINLG